jgi:phage N-6-adenine-methyltransferase
VNSKSRKAATSSKFKGWRTPPEVLAKCWDLGLGPFTLDVCATAGHEIPGCQAYFTPEMNAFTQDWARALTLAGGGCAWMNPPYGREIHGWMTLAALWASRGVPVVALVPARTDTRWWHAFVEPVRLGQRPGTVFFWRGRIRFINEQGEQGDPALFPSAIVHMGAHQ